MLRVRDAMDCTYAQPLDIASPASPACRRPSHPHVPGHLRRDPAPLLQRRRVERAMYLLRATDRSVTDICLDPFGTAIRIVQFTA